VASAWRHAWAAWQTDALPALGKHRGPAYTCFRWTTALSTEGARGPACRRLLARDVQAARVQLRYLEGLRNVVLSRYASGKGSPERLKVLEKLVDNQHRRMLAAIDTLSRLDPAPAAVKISARQAAVVFGRMPDGPR
jgi:hypothetical protein